MTQTAKRSAAGAATRTPSATAARTPAVRAGSGNVFAGLGAARPAEALAKAELARRIAAAIAARGWTQAQAADALGIDQPKVSALVRGRLDGFAIERLLRFLNALGHDVEIAIRDAPARRRPARLTVHTA